MAIPRSLEEKLKVADPSFQTNNRIIDRAKERFASIIREGKDKTGNESFEANRKNLQSVLETLELRLAHPKKGELRANKNKEAAAALKQKIFQIWDEAAAAAKESTIKQLFSDQNKPKYIPSNSASESFARAGIGLKESKKPLADAREGVRAIQSRVEEHKKPKNSADEDKSKPEPGRPAAPVSSFETTLVEVLESSFANESERLIRKLKKPETLSSGFEEKAIAQAMAAGPMSLSIIKALVDATVSTKGKQSGHNFFVSESTLRAANAAVKEAKSKEDKTNCREIAAYLRSEATEDVRQKVGTGFFTNHSAWLRTAVAKWETVRQGYPAAGTKSPAPPTPSGAKLLPGSQLPKSPSSAADRSSFHTVDLGVPQAADQPKPAEKSWFNFGKKS